MADLPDSPEALGIPGYPEWREHQKEITSAIVDALETNETVLVEAPTGAGKTIIGAATSRALGGRALYLAHTIMLQEQQLRTLPRAVTVTGRRNHACLLPVAQELGLTADEADCPCELAEPAGCSYYRQWFAAMDAQDVVLNYAYMVRIVKAHGIRVADGWGTQGENRDVIPNPFVGRRLMVCDEGHNLEQALLAADTVDVYQQSFEKYGYRLPDSVEVRPWLEWATQVQPQVSERLKELNRTRGSLDGLTVDTFKEANRLKGLVQTLDGVKEFGKFGAENPVYVARKAHGYTMQPLWAWNRSKKLLFGHADSSIVMSATLGAPGLTARLLGLSSWAHLKIPSTFPVANRPVFYWPVSKMKYSMGDFDKQKQVVALVHLAQKFPNSPGVVHCNSYALGKYFYEGVARIHPETWARCVFHDSKSRTATFADFEQSPGNRILITPAATTGVDWDFLGWQMIPKVPYPDLSDDIVRLRYDYQTEEGEKLGQEVYTNEAVKTLVQAAGRCVRTPTSKGVTVITDAAFWPLFKYIAPDAFPDWFRAAVSWYEPKGAD
jgi:Rad3-related DNA helicase